MFCVVLAFTSLFVYVPSMLPQICGQYFLVLNKLTLRGLHGIPNAPPVHPEIGAIRKKPLVFGLHNHYYRVA
jgi:hypothetical protein